MAKFKKTEFLELTDAYTKVLYWFFSYPTKEFGLSEIAQLVNISKTTANRVVLQLAKEGFCTIEELGKLWRISCSPTHRYNYTRKVAYNLETIYESGIVEEVLKIIPNARCIVLFGSYRKGDDTEKSDIDIAVEIIGCEEPRMTTLGVVQQLRYRKNVTVNTLTFSRDKIDINLFTNIANGIVLYGLLEVRP